MHRAYGTKRLSTELVDLDAKLAWLDTYADIQASTRTEPPRVEVKHKDPGLAAQFTVREREVMKHLADGCSNRIIAARTDLSIHTVKFHLNNIFYKLGAESRAEVAVFAVKSGIA